MNLPLKPVYLFADSQLLFWNRGGTRFLQSIKEQTGSASPSAAYLGASNGDQPQFYSIFEAAMESVGIENHKMIHASFSSDEESFMNEADIILLAGGDVERGWLAFTETGLKESILRRYYEGSLLIGISAGAAQLGLYGLAEDVGSFNRLIDTFKLVPFLISAHEEKQEWRSLIDTIRLLNDTTRGIGIPSGGGMVYYPDQSIEAIRHPLYEVSLRDGDISQSILMPEPQG